MGVLLLGCIVIAWCCFSLCCICVVDWFVAICCGVGMICRKEFLRGSGC